MTLNRTDAGRSRPEAALAAFERACTGGEPDGCLYAGLMRVEGRGSPTDPVSAQKAFQAACHGRSGAGCYHFGRGLELGDGGLKDLVAARKAYESGCQVDQADACLSLMSLAQQGLGGNKDSKLARSIFQKYCATGEFAVCDDLGERFFPELLKSSQSQGGDVKPVTIAWPRKGTSTSRETELAKMFDYLIAVDSRSWLLHRYATDSVYNVEILNESKDRTSGLVFANFNYADGGGAWVKAKIGRGGVSCLEFHDFAGQCRPVGANPAVGMAMMAFVSAMLAPSCEKYVRGGFFSDEIVTVC